MIFNFFFFFVIFSTFFLTFVQNCLYLYTTWRHPLIVEHSSCSKVLLADALWLWIKAVKGTVLCRANGQRFGSRELTPR